MNLKSRLESSHRVSNYLLAWFDVRVDVSEHRFEHRVVAHTQVLDLYLTVLGPVLRDLRGIWGGGHTHTWGVYASLFFNFNSKQTSNSDRKQQQKADVSLLLLSMLQSWML